MSRPLAYQRPPRLAHLLPELGGDDLAGVGGAALPRPQLRLVELRAGTEQAHKDGAAEDATIVIVDAIVESGITARVRAGCTLQVQARTVGNSSVAIIDNP